MENILDNTLVEEQNQEIVYGGFWSRLGALILDGLVFAPVTICGYFNTMDWKSLPLMVLLSLLPIIYKPFWEFKYGTTIGKKALRLKVVNLQYEKANLQEVLLRNIFHIIFGLLGIVTSVIVFNSSQFYDVTEFTDYGMINQLAGGLIWISYISFVVYLVDIIMLVTDEQKRSFHDRIGQTYVVKSN